ncbi:hypothetical protein V8C37DRAFT_383406 [Trichoderma ceciliae]
MSHLALVYWLNVLDLFPIGFTLDCCIAEIHTCTHTRTQVHAHTANAQMCMLADTKCIYSRSGSLTRPSFDVENTPSLIQSTYRSRSLYSTIEPYACTHAATLLPDGRLALSEAAK